VADPVRVVGFDPTERLVDALVARAGLISCRLPVTGCPVDSRQLATALATGNQQLPTEQSEDPAAAAGGRRS